MKKSCILLFASLFTLHASLAQQGTIQLPASGQTTSYYPGDDGDLQMGVPLPANRFTDHGDGSATDELTGLMWVTDGNLIVSRDPAFDQDRTPSDGDIDWQTAMGYVQLLNDENYLGYNDWRMPNLVEMRSLADLSRPDTALPQGHPFFNLQDTYWTSTTCEFIRGMVATCYMADHFVHSNTTNIAGETQIHYKRAGLYTSQYWSFFLLPVRTSSTPGDIELPNTGQQYTYYTGDDGDLKSGVPMPSPRLVDKDNGTVTDRLTGLMWTKDANLIISRNPELDTLDWLDGYITWEMALDYVAKLNNENYLGHSDWRLPNRNEMTSLFDFAFDHPVLPERFPFINAGEYGGYPYWTSTTLAGEPGRAWVVETYEGMMEDGNNNGYGKETGHLAWPVRTDNTPLPAGSVSGTITLDGNPYPRAEIQLFGPIEAFIRTNLNGEYEFTGLPDGNYTIVPEHKYARFIPLNHQVTISGNHVTCDFDAEYTRAYGWVDISENLFKVGNAAGSNLNDLHFIGNEGWVVNSWAFSEIYHTTDGGQTWEIQEPLTPCNAIHMVSATEGYTAGQSGIVQKTVDGGNTWSFYGIQPSTIDALWFSEDGTNGWACGREGWISHITPSGVVPQNVSFPDYVSIALTPSGDFGWATACSGRKAVYDEGVWTYYGGAMYMPCLNDVVFASEDLMWVAYDHGISRMKNEVSSNVLIDSNAYEGVFALNEDSVWAVGRFGDIIFSTSGNNDTVHWSYDNVGNEVLNEIYVVSGTEAYAVGGNGTIFRYGLLEGFPAGGADILDFVVDQQIQPAEINTEEQTIHVIVEEGTDLTQIIPEIFISPAASIDPPGGTMQNFTNPFTYTVTSENGQTVKEWVVTIDITTGVQEIKKPEVVVYPNPASGVINIQSAVGSRQSAVIEIVDLYGNVLLEEVKRGRGEVVMTVDVSSLPDGVYFVRILIDSQIVVKKIIKL